MILYEPIPGAMNFRWIEALTLREWGWCAYPNDTQKANIIDVAKRLQSIRDYLNAPIRITSWLRPEQYNRSIGGSRLSAHRDGMAVDFTVDGFQDIGGCDAIRARIEPLLDELGLRMERKPASSWVHIDTKEPGLSGRCFTP